MVEKIIEERSSFWREILLIFLLGFVINLLADEFISFLPPNISIFNNMILPRWFYLITIIFFLIIIFAVYFILKPIYIKNIIEFFLIYDHKTDHFYPLKNTGVLYADYFCNRLFDILPEKKDILIKGDPENIEKFFKDLVIYLILHFLQINYFIGWDITTIGEIRYAKAFKIDVVDTETLNYGDLPEYIKNNTFVSHFENAKEWSIKVPQNTTVNWKGDPFAISFNTKYGDIFIRTFFGPKGRASIDQLVSLAPISYNKEVLQYLEDKEYAFASIFIIFLSQYKKWWRLFFILWGAWGLKFVHWSQDMEKKLIEYFS